MLRFFYEEDHHCRITEIIRDEIDDAKSEGKPSIYIGDIDIIGMYINGQKIKEPLESIYTDQVIAWRVGLGSWHKQEELVKSCPGNPM